MRTLVKSAFCSTVLVLGIACLAGAQIYLPAVPQLMTVQGHLTDAGGDPLSDGTYDVAFVVWDASTAGDAVWGETLSVDVTQGMFNVVLGYDNAVTYDVFNSRFRWLGIQVESDPEMTPRQQITTVPFAQTAHNVDLQTITSDHIIDGEITNDDIAPGAAIDMSKIFGGAGVDYSTMVVGTEITTSTHQLASVEMECPTAGYVVLMFSGEATIHGENTIVEVGVGTVASPFAFSQDIGHNPTSTTYYKQSFCPIYTYTVSAGTWTFTANARKDATFDDHPVYIDQVSFVALFVPNRY